VVVARVIAGRVDRKRQSLTAGQIDINFFRRFAGFENAAVEQQFAVAVDAEAYAADFAVDFIVNADVGGEAPV